MKYNVVLQTDIGIKKETNQDSLCVKQAVTEKGMILLAIICDGMGGLEKGEVASATLINAFSEWFENELPVLLGKEDWFEEIRYRWDRMIKEQNQRIGEYGRRNHIQLGTTISAMLIFENAKYLIGHVGDSRIYKITEDEMKILTTDHTLMAREISRGNLTVEQAELDPRRNVLLQCIGASKVVEPEFVDGMVVSDECYMLCSDGFRHMITAEEIVESFKPSANSDEVEMKKNVARLIELNKERQETDNISAILIKII